MAGASGACHGSSMARQAFGRCDGHHTKVD
jgi:hypothetical protein